MRGFRYKLTDSLSPLVTVEFKEHPTETVATEGGLVTFNCNVTGVPKPRITWKKDGELVTNDTRRTVMIYGASSKVESASRLQIRGVSKEDIGEYMCIAWNRGSVREWPSKLLLTGKCLILEMLLFVFFSLACFFSEY